uniref:Uncharacterized protein n=1 Tax=Nelumbo nucifera TaxID=4432 RepID=A0A822Z2M7_NELNU|nr:TPA_asm: hypothetical protein HUJ06_013359 [Nelumbo nucifera]
MLVQAEDCGKIQKLPISEVNKWFFLHWTYIQWPLSLIVIILEAPLKIKCSLCTST